ncbi:PspC domain-containing protein [Aeromicrobium sp. CTD01-1L150]|uniref:PspC domain-containing protein n=1 Tax=Aeromicrobium sp. CTD01-1L150 TaxID=3341830 RepID=UPI0035C00282
MSKKLARSTDDAWIAGVCGGIAAYTGSNPNLIRLLAAVLTILGFGSVVIVYVLLWVLMPKQQPPGVQTITHQPPAA